MEGTPLEDQQPVEPVEMVRMIATARILMPQAMVRLSAGRLQMTEEAQLLCMMAGANSIFFGEKLLTTGNPEYAEDMALLEKAGHPAARADAASEPVTPRALAALATRLGASEELERPRARGACAAASSRSTSPQGAGGARRRRARW